MLRPTLKELSSFVNALIRSVQYDDEEGYWHFGDGTPCRVCTNGAERIAEAFGGEVWGYTHDENPTARLGRAICSGHDFAIVADRWLIDYWGYRWAQEIPRAVFDLNGLHDRLIVRRMYGPPKPR